MDNHLLNLYIPALLNTPTIKILIFFLLMFFSYSNQPKKNITKDNSLKEHKYNRSSVKNSINDNLTANNNISESKSYKNLKDLINKSFTGVNITVSLINQKEITGEVISLFENIITIKSNGILNFIDADSIVSFK